MHREVLHIEEDTSLPAARLIRTLEYLKEFGRLPETGTAPALFNIIIL